MVKRKNARYDETRISTSSGPKDSKTPRGFLYDVLSTVLWAIALAFVLRTALFQPFHIPTSSMEPSLTRGDYIVTSKYAYGYGRYSAVPLKLAGLEKRIFARKPRRGDVAVFRDERTGDNVIKRIIGFEGERIELREGRVLIDGLPVNYQTLGHATSLDELGNPQQINMLRETLSSGLHYTIYDQIKNDRFDDTQAVTVPVGHYFVLGDNRDNSADSRVARVAGGTGFVADVTLMGRAEFVLLSVKEEFAITKPWTWANMRSNRFFKDIP